MHPKFQWHFHLLLHYTHHTQNTHTKVPFFLSISYYTYDPKFHTFSLRQKKMERIKGRSDSEADLLGLFSWPPRSYTCTFCKREFRSAQALGGHMNVHRRDRARLRQSPPLIIRDHQHHHLLNLNLDPNPSFSSTPPRGPKPPRFSFVPPSVSTISTTPPAAVTATGKATNKRFLEVEKVHHDDEKEKERICLGKLELEIGLVSEEEGKEEVDLELRLGYI